MTNKLLLLLMMMEGRDGKRLLLLTKSDLDLDAMETDSDVTHTKGRTLFCVLGNHEYDEVEAACGK